MSTELLTSSEMHPIESCWREEDVEFIAVLAGPCRSLLPRILVGALLSEKCWKLGCEMTAMEMFL